MPAAPAPRSVPPARFPRRHARGSVLVTALIFSAIIAISLTSYIRLSLTSLSLAGRT